jgi:DNA polymerase III delta prime subunit
MNMIIPNDLDLKDFVSTGEYFVYRAFQRDPAVKDWVVLHSIFLQDHVRNLSGEIDFLVLVPNGGIFILEVKHGMVSRKDGYWYFKGKLGKADRKKRGPFEQANEALHSLRKYLIENAGNEQTRKLNEHLLMGTGVIFSSMEEVPQFGPEAEGWQVMGRNELGYPISYFINNLKKGWTQKLKERSLYHPEYSLPSSKMVRELAALIKGDFEISHDNSAILQDNDLLIEQYTSEQFQVIEYANYNDRCLISGAAGTGKTIIALELATRLIRQGKRVGFFCYNRNLGNYLIDKMDGYMGKELDYAVNSYHQFLMHFSKLKAPKKDSTVGEFFETYLPMDILIHSEQNGLENRFDILIIDEAQDLLTSENLEIFDLMLKGGLTKGRWLLFGDFNKQAIYQSDAQNALRLLSKYSYSHVPPLQVNYRNSKNVILHNTYLTGIERPRMLNESLEDFPVEHHFPTTNKMLETFKFILARLEAENLLKETIILSPFKIKNTPIEQDNELKDLISSGKVRYETIHGFKGLESNIVLLTGFRELNSEMSQKLLYVGISRAKQRLIFILDKSVEPEFQKLISKNMHIHDDQ